MKELFDYLEREWEFVSSAPFAFLISSALVASLAYAASRWKHSGIIELLRERLAAKDQQLDDYRERLHLAPASGSSFSKQSHTELQTEALKFVASLRDWLSLRHGQDAERQHQQWVAMTRAADEAEKKRLWDAHTADLIKSSAMLNSEYDAKFKVKAIVLRDELLSRVKHPEPTGHAHQMYDHPTNPIGMGMVADDLERLARLLR